MKVGDVINELTVLERAGTPKGKSSKRGPFYRCLCRRCGNDQYVATSGDLNSGRIKTCGCYRNSQEFADAMVVHGHRRQNRGTTSRTYNIWLEMKRRCDDPSRPNYPWYGGSGITYCEHWKHFQNFLLAMGECPPGLEIDRIDNTKGYFPENCRWVTHKENCNNRREYGSGPKL